MTINLPKNIFQWAAVVLAAAVLLISLIRGVSAGKLQAQSELIVANGLSLAKGLHFFKNDQERYPTAAEFEGNRNLMLNYYSDFPPQNFPTAKCPNSFAYQRPNLGSFNLAFCLQTSVKGFGAGWNQVNENN